MEINQPDVQLDDASLGLISVCVKVEDQESESNDIDVICEANNLCAIEIKEGHSLIHELETTICNNADDLETLSLTFNALEHNVVRTLANNLPETITLGALHPDIINEEIQRRMSQATEVFIDNDDRLQTIPYSVPDFLDGLSLNVKREGNGIYSSEWLCIDQEDTSSTELELRVSKGEKDRSEEPLDVEAETAPATKRKGRTRVLNERYRGNVQGKVNSSEKVKRRLRRKGKPRQDYRERLRRKAECMREKRRKLYEEETEEERLQRLAKEAAKRREMRMYYETPEQRRKRLDAEAARKREYRMYNETPEERRKRLDREAERRRIKRLTLYANETAEQRRERLNRESAKRREARLNQYSKESEDQRRERLRKDALRAREMRFTRSAIETEEERRQRLVKDALRKRELRTHGGHSVSNFTELQTVRSFEELNNVQMRDDPDNQLGSHYLSNWMMWFQNTLTQPVHIGEQTIEPQSQNNG
ncbi:trichohyalin isoform X1 [Neodiprion pinetum]|uniref:Trichohyalin isoform X1 n=1 Tax=Neodiprion lecontei TaxID=441921 RepID=A0A6J0C0X5_NEOLC|nr:trichohyalin isoform X1 [Neodiprion lecontei]XP_046466009.1 trichohyalin-like isoform X1 [Neodiprion pinetum]XP_046466017.1 trichohyalin-like isoform X1 [Neodiprion pinetum]XP_046587463.1 trichohyalin isoform X1 [Neodiprion lecontei]